MTDDTAPRILSIDNALHGIDELLRDRIGPAVADPFAGQMVRLSGLLLRICANGVDDAAELRVTENAAIRALLGEIAALVPVPLSETCRMAAGSADPGLKISVLDAENNRLRRLLTDGQIALEGLAMPAARALDQRIWQFLEQVENKRAPRE